MLAGMVSLPRKKGASYADIEALPEHLVGEIINDTLIVSPRPRPAHALAHFNLGGDLRRFGRGDDPGGWLFFTEPELHVGGDVIVPDLAGWRVERMPTLPLEAYFTLAPDWVCEILSPSTAGHDRSEKLPIYARERVAHAWIIDVDLQTVEVFRLAGAHLALVQTVGVDGPYPVRLEPFDAVELDPRRWWPPA
jgi:Uma2 family endonuclease